jgi:hypothetical protein
MTYHLPLEKKLGFEKCIFSDFVYLKGVIGHIRLGNKKSCINYDRLGEELSEYINKGHMTAGHDKMFSKKRPFLFRHSYF